MRSIFWSVFCLFRMNTGKYGPEKTSYLDTFHAGNVFQKSTDEGRRLILEKLIEKWKTLIQKQSTML